MPGLSRQCKPRRRRLPIVAVMLAACTPAAAAYPPPPTATMRALAGDTERARQLVGLLQSALFTLNPDAVVLGCPEVRVTADGRRAGAACQILDGVVPRRALLCLDLGSGHFALGEVTSPVALDDREGVLRFMAEACPGDA